MAASSRATARAERRPLEIGIDLIPAELAMGGKTPRWTDIRAMAETAEQVGFDSIWLPDHFLLPTDFRVSSDEAQTSFGAWECWSMLSSLASVTNRVQLGTLVLGGGYRNPALLAKMADTVDEISDGRLILGIGSGWVEYEYQAFGYPHDHLVSRFEEAIQIIRALLKDGHVSFEGKYYKALECELRPRGPRPDGPPIMIGSRSPRMHRLAAKYADIWNGAWSANAEKLEPMLDAIDEACRDVGRDPHSLVCTAGVLVALPGHYPHRQHSPVWRQMLAGAHLTGSSDEIAAGLLEYYDRGISHIQVILDPMTVEGIEEFGVVLDALDQSASSSEPAAGD
jgi:probable F420-dependent oxidoreductase